MACANPTPSRLKELFDYDESTGLLFWKTSIGTRAKVGSAAGSPHGTGYINVRIDGVGIRAHRIVWAWWHGKWPSGMLDHIDGDKLNNRIQNLRDVTASVNQQNRYRPQKNNVAGLIGAHFDARTGRFMSNITVNGKQKYLGRFNSAQEAHEAYLRAKREFHEPARRA